MIAASWASDTLNFWAAEDNADDAGPMVPRGVPTELEDDDSRRRALAGARVILGALAELGGDVVLDTVALLGAAIEADSACESGRYAAGIRTSATECIASLRERRDRLYDLRRDHGRGRTGL
ncbi:hypothetical protein C485_15889 [Natrinema altunense JCM 12890]|uniref:Uncharacterized protein n=1 Tax=Natrinema altunense (strain JCM 12890 / CGMCC 1.3731 / AJ2) TaxID=1227494 RepID=L9ZCS3_NATA2|nr:hypothetical protein C485_15889 [Natrinema altunense JCM 12890]